MFSQLLLPVDGSEGSDRALDHAVRLAKTYDASVHALYVIDDGSLPFDFDAVAKGEQVRTAVESTGDDALAAVEERCEAAGVPVTSEQREGVPATVILDCAADREADLLVTGTHRRNRLERFLDRSVTQQVSREATVPVLAVPVAAATVDYQDVLLASDGRQGAERATECALDIVGRYRALLHGLYVLDSRFARSGPLKEAVEREASETTRRLRARAAQEGRDVVIAQREGRPAAEILDYTDVEEMDLIVLGTHGRTGLDRFLMGSVAGEVLREATVPVLTARTLETA